MRNDWKCPLLDSVLTPVGQTGSGMSAIINYIFVSKSSFRLWIKPVSRSCWKFCAMFFDFLMGSLYETVNSGIPSSSLPPSLPSFSCCFMHCEAAIFIIMNIICINHQDKWLLGDLNASFRETWLPCHSYKLQAGQCFTWGLLPPLPAACTHSCWRVSRVGHTADISHMPNCINVRKQIKFYLF